jgi:hypothetical protein
MYFPKCSCRSRAKIVDEDKDYVVCPIFTRYLGLLGRLIGTTPEECRGGECQEYTENDAAKEPSQHRTIIAARL